MTLRQGLIWLLCAALLALFGCDDEAVDTGGVVGPQDSALPDPDEGLPPLPPIEEDTGVDPDMSMSDADAAAPDNRCESNDDCDSRYCVPGPDGERVCTNRCGDQDDCPEGWECSPIANAGPDTVFICVAIRRVQCDLCDHDGDCGAGGDRCVQIGRSQRCARDCSAEACPDGSVCEMRTIDGDEVPLCIPEVGSCDPCVDPDEDGYGNQGECRGLDCDEENPDINAGAREICDGRDNDCDSIPDNNVGAEDAPEDFTCLSAGVCTGAVASCVSGAWSCTYPDTYEADAEATCDGLDNDCDAVIDEALEAPPADLVVGVCIEAVRVCGGGDGFVEPDYTALEGYEAEEITCDGLDNDCDNVTDEGVDRPAADRQAGVCVGSLRVCGGDGGFVEPDYGQIDGFENVEASCDGIDNDCDGEIDEALQAPPGDNQVGVCAGAVKVCDGVNGFAEPNYGEQANHQAVENLCDGLDNDCDGELDEGIDLGAAANQDGVCSGSRLVCAGADGIVEPDYADIRTYEAIELSCDGEDNDCDGEIDEMLTPPPARNQDGICAGAVKVCSGYDGFAEPEYGGLNGHEAVEQTCDGRDNDCDGITDEGVEYPIAARQDGVCAGSRLVCGGQAGLQEPNYGQLDDYENLESTCDGLDNDCDGSVDEAIEPPLARVRAGVCAGARQVCDGVNGFVEPIYGQIEGYEADEASCDGEDNDCDGETDEAIEAPPADLAVGVCAGAVKVCRGRDGFLEPTYGEIGGYEAVETTCDGRDNDCDGIVDEGVDAPIADVQFGICEGARKTCSGVGGFVEPDYTRLAGYLAEDTPADNLDTNCDGVVGLADRMVYVSLTLGDDANSGLSPQVPKATLGAGIAAAAQALGRNTVAVAVAPNSAYQPDDTLGLSSGVQMYGGYSDDFATRDGTRVLVEVQSRIGVDALNLDVPTHVDGFDFRVSLPPQALAEEAIGLRCISSDDNLRLRNVRIHSGDGGNGSDGANGNQGDAGLVGGDGDGSVGGNGGAAGGGQGGSGRNRGVGEDGTAGAANGGAGGAGGQSNDGGRGCNDGSVQAGGNGRVGGLGQRGAHGAPGEQWGQWVGLNWIPAFGAHGETGGRGGGGGGGAAGGGENCTTETCRNVPLIGRVCTPDVCVFCGTGRGGGGGGGGGDGGTGGRRGGGGGAAIGILIQNSTIHLHDAGVQMGSGGTGGRGGSGGTGGPGGRGGFGADSNEDSDGDGGNGGSGGTGGAGGCGAGGTSGPSVGYWGRGGAAVVRTGEVADTLSPGVVGGAVCLSDPANANAGQASAVAQYVDVEVR